MTLAHETRKLTRSRRVAQAINMSLRTPDGKPVALVIGSSRGMGRQIAISLAEEGYTGKMSTEGSVYSQ